MYVYGTMVNVRTVSLLMIYSVFICIWHVIQILFQPQFKKKVMYMAEYILLRMPLNRTLTGD